MSNSDPTAPPAIPDSVWAMFKERLGYDDEELETFESNPRNARVIAVGPELIRKTIVFEVVESHGCNCGHTVGTKFYFSGEGTLVSKMAPASKVMPSIVIALATAGTPSAAAIATAEAIFRTIIFLSPFCQSSAIVCLVLPKISDFVAGGHYPLA